MVAESLGTIKISGSLDVNGATHLTRLLYKEVAAGNVTFELRSEEGTVGLDILVTILKHMYDNITVTDALAISGLAGVLAKQIHSWLKKEKEEKGRHNTPVKMTTIKEQVTITEDKITITRIKEDFEKTK